MTNNSSKSTNVGIILSAVFIIATLLLCFTTCTMKSYAAYATFSEVRTQNPNFEGANTNGKEIVSKEIVSSSGPVLINSSDATAYHDAYKNIPLTYDEIILMARMAMAETMAHDGTCPQITVEACYETVFNRYLYDAANGTNEYHSSRRGLSITSIVKSGQMVIAKESRFNNISQEAKNMYITLAYKVYENGPTVLLPELVGYGDKYTALDYKYWQSRGNNKRELDNRIYVGWIYDDNGNIVPGIATNSERSRIVGYKNGNNYSGNWYRVNFK